MNFQYLKEAVGSIFSDYLPTDEQIKELQQSIEVANEYMQAHTHEAVPQKNRESIQVMVSICCTKPVNIHATADFGGSIEKYTCQACNNEAQVISKTYYSD